MIECFVNHTHDDHDPFISSFSFSFFDDQSWNLPFNHRKIKELDDEIEMMESDVNLPINHRKIKELDGEIEMMRQECESQSQSQKDQGIGC